MAAARRATARNESSLGVLIAEAEECEQNIRLRDDDGLVTEEDEKDALRCLRTYRVFALSFTLSMMNSLISTTDLWAKIEGRG